MASPRPSPTRKLRLQRFLAECGAGSRRGCEELIRAGRLRSLVAAAAIELGKRESGGIEPAASPVEQVLLAEVLALRTIVVNLVYELASG